MKSHKLRRIKVPSLGEEDLDMMGKDGRGKQDDVSLKEVPDRLGSDCRGL